MIKIGELRIIYISAVDTERDNLDRPGRPQLICKR